MFKEKVKRWFERNIAAPDPYDDESISATRYRIQREAEERFHCSDTLQGVPQ